MKIKDIMTWNVITVSSETPMMEARKIMETHKIRRLPVVDKGKLVGVVTLDRIIRMSPSPATTLSVWEINYILAKMQVKEAMHPNVVSISPTASVEQGLVQAQAKNVGIMPAVEKGAIIGVVTTTDFSLKVMNPLIGLNQKGIKLKITPCGTPEKILDVMTVLKAAGVRVVTQHTIPTTENNPTSYAVLLDTTNATKIIKDLEGKGFKVENIVMS